MIQQLAAGVYRITLPHPALFATNVYFIQGEPAVLVDAGHGFAAAQTKLRQALDEIQPGLTPDLICLTDAMPDRVGLALSGGTAVAAHELLPQAVANYGAFNLLYRRELVVPVFEDAHLFRRFSLTQLQEAVNHAYGGGGVLHVNEPVTSHRVWQLGQRKLHALLAPGSSSSHCMYLLEPEGFLFSGDIGYAQGLEPPPLIRGLGGNIPHLLKTLEKVRGINPKRVLPGAGEPLFDGAKVLERSRLTHEQLLSQIKGMLCAGPRELSRLLDLLSLGEGLSPLRLVHRLAVLRVALTALVADGEAEEIYEDRVFTYRLGTAALHARKQGAAA